MFTKQEIERKIAEVKALDGKTVQDILVMPEFLHNLGKYLDAQRQDREAIRSSFQAMHKLGGAMGMKLPSHPVDKFLDMTPEDFAEEYRKVIGAISDRPAAQRLYIRQLGQQAYNLTIANFVVAEFPELRDYFFEKGN